MIVNPGAEHARIIRALTLRLGGRVTLTVDELTIDDSENFGMIFNHMGGEVEVIAIPRVEGLFGSGK